MRKTSNGTMPSSAVNTSMLSAIPIGMTPIARTPSGAAATVINPIKVWFSPAARDRNSRGTSIAVLAAAAGAWKACIALRTAIMA